MTLVAPDDRQSKIDELEQKIQRLEKKNQRLQLAQDDAAKQVIDAIGRGKRLAQSLGFQEVAEAQLYIDSLDDELDLRQLIERAKLHDEGAPGSATDYDQIKAEREELKKELQGLRENRYITFVAAFWSRLTPSRKDTKTQQELAELHGRYDAILVDRLRSSEYFKGYYAKFKRFNKWWTTHDPQAEPDWDQLSDAEKKIRKERFIAKRRADIAQFGIEIGKDGDDYGVLGTSPWSVLCRHSRIIGNPTTTPGPGGSNRPTESRKENGETPLPPTKKRRVSSPAFQTSSRRTSRHSFLQPSTPQTTAHVTGPSFSPTVFNNAKIEPTSPRLGSDTPSKPRLVRPVCPELLSPYH